jgi:chitinase
MQCCDAEKKGRKKLIQMTGASAQIELQHKQSGFLMGMIFFVVKSWSMVVMRSVHVVDRRRGNCVAAGKRKT